jgi:NAD-dependent SIR2 family protein deacetylase
MTFRNDYRRAASFIAEADGLIITAGAGMGVDSGLPNFRGSGGFWRAYPGLASASIEFKDIACPKAFSERPLQAWGFYGHRMNLYRLTPPHQGFFWLRLIGESLAKKYFVYTSNVDGQFQKAGFAGDRIVECHGSIHFLQCCTPCCVKTWSADSLDLQINERNCTVTSPLPECPRCTGLARPNVLMFGDSKWEHGRRSVQDARYCAWLRKLSNPVVIEIGAGTAIPTCRHESESAHCAIVRINPEEPEIRTRGVSLPVGAKEGIFGIVTALIESGWLNVESLDVLPRSN